MPTAEKKVSAYDKVTDRLIELIDAGVCPWKPTTNCRSARPGKNIKGNNYRGINAMMTWAVASIEGYASDVWLTFKQAQEMGGTVRKGQKGTPIIFWGIVDGKGDEAPADDKKSKGYAFARYYVAFNVEQCDGIDVADLPDTTRYANDPIVAAESIVAGFNGPKIAQRLSTPCYNFVDDVVYMPPVDRFVSSEAYYETLFHELGHSTGHHSRLNREMSQDRPKYAFEELVAEMAAAFLCDEAGILPSVETNVAAYLDGWGKAIKADRSMLIKASSAAQKAADMILGRQFASV